MIVFLSLLAALLSKPDFTCNSTIFGLGSKLDGGNTLYLGRPVKRGDFGIAHRTLPLGTPVLVLNKRTGLTAGAIVIDRGPYGAISPQGVWFIRNPPNRHLPGRYRGCADLTPTLAEAIGHDGMDRVSIWRLD